MAFYGRSTSVREDVNRRNARTMNGSPSDSTTVQQQLGELMKMMKDQKEAVEACLAANRKLSDKVSNLQESVTSIEDKVKEGSVGGRKKIPCELSVRISIFKQARVPAKTSALAINCL